MTRVTEVTLICLMRPRVYRLQRGVVGKDVMSGKGASWDGVG